MKDIQKNLETNMYSFVDRENFVTFLSVKKQETGGERFCVRLRNTELEI
jgi:hypothetical protein